MRVKLGDSMTLPCEIMNIGNTFELVFKHPNIFKHRYIHSGINIHIIKVLLLEGQRNIFLLLTDSSVVAVSRILAILVKICQQFYDVHCR